MICIFKNYTIWEIYYSIKINGYINPNEFMNNLYYMLIQKFGIDNCYIEASKYKYKLTIIFEEEIEKDEMNESDEEEEESNEIKMQIILYKIYEEYILKFENNSGNKMLFLDKFDVINNIMKYVQLQLEG